MKYSKLRKDNKNYLQGDDPQDEAIVKEIINIVANNQFF